MNVGGPPVATTWVYSAWRRCVPVASASVRTSVQPLGAVIVAFPSTSTSASITSLGRAPAGALTVIEVAASTDADAVDCRAGLGVPAFAMLAGSHIAIAAHTSASAMTIVDGRGTRLRVNPASRWPPLGIGSLR